MRFRQHRGGLEDSLSTTVEIADLAALVTYARTLPGVGKIDAADIGFTPYGGRDERIGWTNVHVVTIAGCIIGFIEGVPK